MTALEAITEGRELLASQGTADVLVYVVFAYSDLSAWDGSRLLKVNANSEEHLGEYSERTPIGHLIFTRDTEGEIRGQARALIHDPRAIGYLSQALHLAARRVRSVVMLEHETN